MIVTAIQSLDKSAQAQLFVDINENQKPVDPNIVWRLYTTIQSDKKNYVIAQAVIGLNDRGPLANRVFIPGISRRSKRSYRVFIANICSSLISSNIIDELRPPIRFEDDDAERLASLVRRYMADLERYLTPRWKRDFFWTNNGVSVLLLLLRSVLRNQQGTYDRQETRRLLGTALRQFCGAANLYEERAHVSSGAGRQNLAVRIERLVAKSDRDQKFKPILRRAAEAGDEESDYDVIRRLETRLRIFVMKSLETAKPGTWWPDLIPEEVVDIAKRHKTANEHPFPWHADAELHEIYYVDFALYSWIIGRNWPNTFQRVFKDKNAILGKLKELEPIRNKIAHNRPMNEEDRERLRLYARDILRSIDRTG